MDTKEQAMLDDIRVAMKDPNVSIRFPYMLSHGVAVQVYIKTRKIGPVIIPDYAGGQTLAEILSMLGDFAAASS